MAVEEGQEGIGRDWEGSEKDAERRGSDKERTRRVREWSEI